MREQELLEKTRNTCGVDQIMWSHFHDACRDPHATITAVNDFVSFSRVLNSNRRRKVRKDRLEKLYNLYLAICKTRLPLSKKLLEQFRKTVPGYENVSFFYFLHDICQLWSAGILIVSTPILDALAKAKESRRLFTMLQKKAGDQVSDPEFADEMIELMLKDVGRTPPVVWPNL